MLFSCEQTLVGNEVQGTQRTSAKQANTQRTRYDDYMGTGDQWYPHNESAKFSAAYLCMIVHNQRPIYTQIT